MSLIYSASDIRLLYAAFLKTRQWQWEAPYYDTVEVRLFEWRLPENLKMLSEHLRRGYIWNPVMRFPVPKKPGEDRPFSYRNFKDEVASVALVLAVRDRLEHAMDRHGRVSFGNRLAGLHTSDRLYLDWRTSWGAFDGASRASAGRNRYYVKTDIRNFYPSIRQGNLLASLRRFIGDDRLFYSLREMLVSDGPALGIGPSVSGVCANIYLTPLDDALGTAWRLRGRYTRYVDDMFLFGNDRRALVGTFASLRGHLWHHFGLTSHAGKAEVGRTRDLLAHGPTPASWVNLSSAYDRIARSLYHVPPSYLQLYARYPVLTIRAYAQGLRAAGIFVSTDWIAQHFLSLRGRRALHDPWSSYYHLRFPRLDLKTPFASAASWGSRFLRDNPDFARDIGKIRGELMRGFAGTCRRLRLGPGADPKKLKPAMLHLRFYASRLALFNCGPVSGHFEKFLDAPWALEASVTTNALLSAPNAVDIFLRTLFSRRALLVRVRAAWALGEAGSIRAVPALWRAAHPGFPMVLRRAALEALVRIDRFDGIHPGAVLNAARVEKDPGIRKYLYILMGRMNYAPALPFLRDRARTERDFFAMRAAEFATSKAGNLWSRPAPAARHANAPLLPAQTRLDD